MNAPIANLTPTSIPQLLRLKQVQEHTGISRSTIYSMMNPKARAYDPTFPKSIQLSPRTVAWVAAELEAWIVAKAAAGRG